MHFLRQNRKKQANEYAQDLLTQLIENERIAPGFGQCFGGTDLITDNIAKHLLNLEGAGPTLNWGHQFAQSIHHRELGWLPTGLAAAVFTDLGFQPKAGATLFQLISSPGLAAHGLELANKPFTAMPYVHDKDYVIG